MLKQVIFAIALLLPAFDLWAGLPEGTPPVEERHQGILDVLQTDRHIIGIGDRVFFYTEDTRIYKPNGTSGSPSDLAQGQGVSYSFTLDQGGRPVITHIWLQSGGQTSQSWQGLSR